MRILITGGCGFIGSNFILYLLKNYPGDSIVNLDKLTYAANPKNLDAVTNNPRYIFVKGDICNGKLVSEVITGCEAIINFAAESHVDRSITEPASFIQTNINGTATLLEACRQCKISRYMQISCYDEKTRAFTYNGLKNYNEIKEGDLVLTLNTETNKVEWKPVEKIIIQDYKGRMIEMKTDTVDFLVTPNHRMLIQMKKSKKLVYKIAEDVAKERINNLPKYYQWEGKVPEVIKNQKSLKDFMYLLGIFIGDGFISYQEKKHLNKTGLDRKTFLKEARDNNGKFKSMGKIGEQNFSISKSWRIFLDIPENDRCRKRCESSLDHLGIRWHGQKGLAGEHLYFTSKDYFEIFKQCGLGAKNKKIPPWALESPAELLYSLLEGLLDSDGSKGYIYFTTSLELAHQVMILCVKLGFNPMLKVQFRKSKIRNRDVSGFLYYILISKREWRSVRKEIIREKDYNGKIWCLKIKDNKNFLVERNGKTAFCGNTDEVYGSIKEGTADEESPLCPSSPYSASKASADLLCLSYYTTYRTPVLITRSSNNYGPKQYPEKLIPLFITRALSDKPVPLYGDGQNQRDWLFVEDNCRAIDLVLRQGKEGEIYNVGTGRQIPNIEVVKILLDLLDKPLSLIQYVPDRPGHDWRYAVNWAKLKALGWQPAVSFEEGLKLTISWYRNH